MIMEWWAAFTGYLLWAVIGAFSIAVAVNWICQLISRLKDKIMNADKDAITRRVGAGLWNDGWWFSEDEDAMHALQLIGKSMSMTGGYRVDTVREEWRRQRAAKGKTLEPIAETETEGR